MICSSYLISAETNGVPNMKMLTHIILPPEQTVLHQDNEAKLSDAFQRIWPPANFIALE